MAATYNGNGAAAAAAGAVKVENGGAGDAQLPVTEDPIDKR